MRFFLLLIIMLMPSRLKIFLYVKLFKWQIDPTAKIGFSLLLCDHLVMEARSSIGALTTVKGLASLRLDERSSLGSLNWITGFPLGVSKHFSLDLNRNPTLHIKEHGAITNRHLIDCTDSVTVGRFSTFAGFRSQVLTHSINLKEARQRCKPVVIGDYCFIGTGSTLLPGSQVPNNSILAAGAVLSHAFSDEGALYGGIPAKKIKTLNLDEYKYMGRTEGYIW
jgi:acetyltransferase-like isoleucine patch superfamily enzyme